MKESILYTLTYLPSQALGIYSIYKLVRAFFEERIVKKHVEVIAFIGYYVLTSSIYLLYKCSDSKFCGKHYINFCIDVYVCIIN